MLKKIPFFKDPESIVKVGSTALGSPPPFLINQIEDWVYKKAIIDFNLMTNISPKWRKILTQNITFKTINIKKKVTSQKSQTTKFLFETKNKEYFESVLIEGKNKDFTLCTSSQIGCSLNCTFCATGTMKLKRNLSNFEIVEQFFWLNQAVRGKVKNIVFMGMGEPLLNLKNVFSAIRFLVGKLGLREKSISISTSGIVKGIEKLSEEKLKVNLCLSLHSAIQETRNLIMPDLVRVPITDLKKALLQLNQKNLGDILIEYIMLKEVNDDERHLAAFIAFLKGLKVKVNLIAYNKVKGKTFSPSPHPTIKKFQKKIVEQGYQTIQRYKKGDDIDAACGQLVLDK